MTNSWDTMSERLSGFTKKLLCKEEVGCNILENKMLGICLRNFFSCRLVSRLLPELDKGDPGGVELS